ncbi:MAG: hypothetical protein H6766_07775 [Candidatus Peribacteria bacterium]|nr:MAG: hypothetical protein H6766_07775 [Candidatus Peribacteria bacterium]
MGKKLKSNGKKKLNKALTRVEKVVILDIRRGIEQQKKWKAKIMNRQQQVIQKIADKQAETA